MNCDAVTRNLSLFLYGELPLEDEQAFQDHLEACASCRKAFQEEQTIHERLNERELQLPSALLARCRYDLNARLASAVPRRRNWFSAFWSPLWLRPAGAVALVALGFFGARWSNSIPAASPNDPVVSRIRYVQPEPSGQVRVVVEETRQHLLTGDPGDARIQRLLLAATRESTDPGLRAESVDILRTRPVSHELRGALVYALEHDTNPGVRLKALDALRPMAGDAEVRSVLAKVLLADDNPGVRAQAIDLLVQKKEDAIVGVLQELVQRDSNDYVRSRCKRALQEMDASVGTF